MDRGLYIAASAMLAEQQRQTQLANNLANATTPGYKADRSSNETFGDVLLSSGDGTGSIGSLTRGVQMARPAIDLTSKGLNPTDEPLDLAIDGDGFFAVRTGDGVRYTRNGSFTANAARQLVDAAGNPVLSRAGQPVTLRPDGTVDPATVGVTTLRGVAKAGENLFTGTPAGQPTGIVRAGMLEESGVDEARTIIEMTGSMRAYQAAQKAITTIDDTLRQSAGQLGSVPQ
jgi:flagellar basal-body rod protein FlgG